MVTYDWAVKRDREIRDVFVKINKVGLVSYWLLCVLEMYFLVLINSKSGGQDGQHLLEKFREVKDEGQFEGEVVSLTDPGENGGVLGPGPALKAHKDKTKLRILACGGDGTVGWILSEVDNIKWGPAGKPPIAIVPLGTGNDLSRSLNWGGKYKDKPINKLLQEVKESDPTPLDRWRLDVSPAEGEKHPDASDIIPQQISVVNNYFSVGIDAHIALQFHKARNANQDKFTSRTRNLLFYTTAGAKDLVRGKYRQLMDDVSCVVHLEDGSQEDVTDKLKECGAHAILLLNIKNYSGGTKPWKKTDGGESSFSDGLIEVIALDNIDLPLLQIGGKGIPVAQARKVTISTRRALPMQVDGEPLLVNPCTITLSLLNTGNMLVRNKTYSGCGVNCIKGQTVESEENYPMVQKEVEGKEYGAIKTCVSHESHEDEQCRELSYGAKRSRRQRVWCY